MQLKLPRPSSASGPDSYSFKQYTLPSGLSARFTSTPEEVAYLYKEHFLDRVYFQHGVQIKPGNTVVDCGANIGLFSMLCAEAVGPTGHVIAVEPCPALSQACKLNLAAHADWHRAQGLKVAPSLVLNAALGDGSTDVATLTVYKQASGWSTLYPDEVELADNMASYLDTIIKQPQERPQLHPVQQLLLDLARGPSSWPSLAPMYRRTLQAYVQQVMMSDVQQVRCKLTTLQRIMEQEHIEHIDLLKVDVERAELDVLRGLAPGQWSAVSQVAMEVHDEGGRLDAVKQLLLAAGFSSIVASKDRQLQTTNLVNVFATRQ